MEEVQKLAATILARVSSAAESGDTRWFLTPEAVASAGALHHAAIGPDGTGPAAAVYALGFFNWCRYVASEGFDLGAVGAAVFFLVPIFRADPESMPPVLHPVFATLLGEPGAAETEPSVAHDVASGLLTFFYEHHHPNTLLAAEKLMRHAAAGFPRTDVMRGGCLSTLGVILLYRFEADTEPELLAEAVSCSLTAVAAAPGDRAEQARRSGNLGLVLTGQAAYSGDRSTAEQGVSALRQAVELSEPTDPQRATFLANLGDALGRNAKAFSATELLPEAVQLLRLTVSAMDPGTPGRAARLAALGTALLGLSSAFDQPGALDQSIAAYQEAVATAPQEIERTTYLTNLAYALHGRAKQLRSPNSSEAAHAAAQRALDAASPGHPLRHEALFVLGRVQAGRFEASGDLGDLEMAIATARQAAKLTPPAHSSRVGRLVDLSGLLRERAQATGIPESAAEAVEMMRRAVQETPPESADRVQVLFELGLALDQVHELDPARHDTDEDPDEAVRSLRKCLDLPTPDRRFLARVRSALGMTLGRRAVSRGDTAGWREGADLVREATGFLQRGDADRTKYLSDLGKLYLERAKVTGDPELHAEAVRLLREAVADAVVGTGQEANCRSDLGVALAALGRLIGDIGLLTESIRIEREVVAGTPPGAYHRPLRLGNLGIGLHHLAEYTSDLALLDEAIGVLREGVAAASDDYPARAHCLSQLGNALRALAGFTGEPAHLQEAARHHREALTLFAATGKPSAGQLNSLCTVLEDLCGYTQDETLRDEALRLLDAELSSKGHGPEERATLLNSLGLSLWHRGEATGDDRLLEAAIGTLREAAATIPERHASRPWVLMTLGGVLAERSMHTGDPVWLEETVDVLRLALAQCSATGFHRAGILSNLAVALHLRYQATGDRAAADEAIALNREAASIDYGDRLTRDLARTNLGILQLSLASDEDPQSHAEAVATLERTLEDLGADHPRRGFVLSNLAAAHWAHAEFNSDTDWLSMAVKEDTGSPAFRSALHSAAAVAREALTCTPDGHPDRARAELILSRTQLRRASLGERVDFTEATHLARTAAETETASITVRLHAARAWGDIAAAAGHDAEALAGYTYAVELLTRAAPRSLNRAAQENRLGGSLGLASDAAAFALRAQDPGRALGLLEQGRGVLLAQGLDARGDLSRLRELDPGLATEFEQLRNVLSIEVGAVPMLTGATGAYQGRYEAGSLAEARHARARDWDRIVEQIRVLPGMQGFLRPPTTEELLASAADGPVVVVNVSRYRSDAILVTGEGIEAVELTGLSTATALERATAFITAVDEAYGSKGAESAPAAMHSLNETLEWLWETVAKPVLDRLGWRHAPEEGQPWPRLFWCPTGWLSFLPLHAAGRHLASTHESVLDRAVSSYTPTLRALIRARAQIAGHLSPEPQTRPTPLVIAIPDTPGAGPLPGTEREAALIGRLFPGTVELAGPKATVDAVRQALARHSWAHFSCHGVSDLEHPSDGGLQLYDGRLKAADVAAQHLTDPALAVLSACSTSQGGFLLPDEVIHVASSFQLAGYPHVIGTLWPVSDKLSTQLTEDLYTSLAADVAAERSLDPATALHRPVRALRDRLAHAPHLWAAHIHAGP